MEGVRLVVGDAMEGARLLTYHSLDVKHWQDLVRSTGHETSKCLQTLPFSQTGKSFRPAPWIFSVVVTIIKTGSWFNPPETAPGEHTRNAGSGRALRGAACHKADQVGEVDPAAPHSQDCDCCSQGREKHAPF